MRGEASTRIQATPEHVWALISDVTRMGEWSPECRRCDWVDGATGPAVGSSFKGHNKRGFARWTTTCHVVAAEPAKVLAFKVGDPDKASAMTWRYELRADGAGTVLTETFDQTGEQPGYYRVMHRLMGIKDRQADMTAGMGTTLARIKAAAEWA